MITTLWRWNPIWLTTRPAPNFHYHWGLQALSRLAKFGRLISPYRRGLWGIHFDSWPTVLIDKQSLIARRQRRRQKESWWRGVGVAMKVFLQPMRFAVCRLFRPLPHRLCRTHRRSLVVSTRLWWLCRFMGYTMAVAIIALSCKSIHNYSSIFRWGICT